MKTSLFDIRNILSRPSMYDLFSNMIAPNNASVVIVNDYIKTKNNDRVLDIGCGNGYILDFLPDIEYLGLDMNQRYIDAAIKKFSSRGNFLCEKISKELINKFKDYDIVLALNVIHHLDNDEASQLFEVAKSALKPGGRLITIDGCYRETQSRLERFLLHMDRGKYVRTKNEYMSIASEVFSKIKEHTRNDLLYIPYTHFIMECMA